jgi:hypothetical protein
VSREGGGAVGVGEGAVGACASGTRSPLVSPLPVLKSRSFNTGYLRPTHSDCPPSELGACSVLWVSSSMLSWGMFDMLSVVIMSDASSA